LRRPPTGGMGFRARCFVLLVLAGCEGSASMEETRTLSEPVQQCLSQSVAQTGAQSVAQTGAETVEGVDVFDGQGQVDWAAVAATGIRFAFIKATQGTYDTQTTFALNWSQAQSAGLLRSAYHFFDPTEDGAAQAAHFLSVIGEVAPRDLPPMLDIECPDGEASCLYSGGSGLAPGADITTRMWAFINAVEQATGRKPVVYTFGAYLEENDVGTSGLSAYPLALAYPSNGTCVSPPAPWARATFWQYSWEGSIDGILGPVDRDRFMGTLSDLQVFAGAPAPPAPTVASTPPPTPAAPPTPSSASTPAPASPTTPAPASPTTPAPASPTTPAPASPTTPAPASPTTPASVSGQASMANKRNQDAGISTVMADLQDQDVEESDSAQASGCACATTFSPSRVPLVMALASGALLVKRRRAVAPGGASVLAGRTATPCRRRIFAKV
jgi:lysozyme